MKEKNFHRVSHEFFFTAATHESISPGALPAVKPAHLTHEFGDKKQTRLTHELGDKENSIQS